MSDFDPNPHQNNIDPNPTMNVRSSSSSELFSYVKIFGYMGMFLAISTVLAVVLGIVFERWMYTDPNTAMNTMSIMMIVAVIAQLALSIFISFFTMRKGKSVLVPAILYSLVMGFMLSTFTTFISWSVLGITFGITTSVFALMALLGFLTKGKATGLQLVISGLGLGVLLMAGFNLIFMFVFPSAFETIYWIISFAVFALIMFVTIFDIVQVKRIVQSGQASNNISMYLAFQLYLDFIMLLIRILYYVIIFSRRN